MLVVDFQPFATGRRLGELLAGEDLGLAISQLEPARDLVGRDYLPLDELAAEYADSFEQMDCAPATTVLGYCSGAVLALRIAERLAGDRQVGVVLLRPTWPGPEMIAAMLSKVRSELGTPTGPAPELAAEPDRVLAQIGQLLHAELRALAELHGLDPDSGPLFELLDRYRGWFGYLLAAQDGLRARRVPELDLQVLLEESESAAVPWFEPGSYRCRRLWLAEDDARATEQLARALAEQFRRPGG